ncbi:MAG TPA: EAL domain-containing protein [Xanthobacteraceae bacterium]|jgi:diguanylate cyclase (GGDEF)-like protein/PAS domain S-box-containing protein|nr:EAL domain-containing protein [Xanthobacteraceae bacterium]
MVSLLPFAKRGVSRLFRRIDWTQRAVTDALVIGALAVVAYFLSQWVDLFNAIVRFQAVYGDWGLDDLVLICVVLSFGLTAFGWRRYQDLKREIAKREAAEEEVRQTIKETNRAKTFLKTIVDNVPTTIVVRDFPGRRFVLLNREAEKLLSAPREQLLGKTPAEILSVKAAHTVEEHDVVILESQDAVVFDEEVSIPTRQHGVRITVSTGATVRDEHGTPRYLINVVQDVTERKSAEQKIAHLAHHDPLTDLPNRTAFNEHMEALLARVKPAGDGFALMCIDLDRFKEVNDVFGHAVGDDLLCAVARRLETACQSAFVARFGGDEFVVVSADGPQPAAAEALAERVFQALDDEIAIAGNRLRAGMSIGVAVYPADGTELSVLLANADAALYRAKSEARGSIRFFEPDMDKRLRERRALQHDLRAALTKDEFELYYQPQASIDGHVTGFEALVRWNHPARGMVSPGVFIPLAEENGVIIPLGEWILHEACREAAAWPATLGVAINLSPAQFRHGDLPSLVHSTLLDTGLAANRLEFEITEGVLISDFSRAISILRRLKSLGVRIAMDDFGTGYSSLSYLQAFPFDKIKIDQGFIANLDRNPQSAAIIRAVIGLGHGLNLPIVAEGVETKEQLAFLRREKCNEVQGYLVGRPAPIAQYSRLTGAGGEPVRPKAAAAS